MTDLAAPLELRLGKKDPVPLDMADLAYYATTPLPAPPTQAHYGGKVTIPWEMYGNDTLGDCVLAMTAHKVICDNYDEFGQTEPVPDTDALEALYHQLSPDDDGLVISDVMKLWRKPGLPIAPGAGLETIAAFAPFNQANLTEFRQGLAFYGGICLGIQCPQSALDQFNAGKAWTVVPGSPIVGGHGIFCCGYSDQWVFLVTWDKLIAASWDFIQTYADEGYVAISKQLRAAGWGPTKIRVSELAADIEHL